MILSYELKGHVEACDKIVNFLILVI
jgi:hypothetical protein